MRSAALCASSRCPSVQQPAHANENSPPLLSLGGAKGSAATSAEVQFISHPGPCFQHKTHTTASLCCGAQKTGRGALPNYPAGFITVRAEKQKLKSEPVTRSVTLIGIASSHPNWVLTRPCQSLIYSFFLPGEEMSAKRGHQGPLTVVVRIARKGRDK